MWVCQRLRLTFPTVNTQQPPVTSVALTWHVKTALKTSEHHSPHRIFGCIWHATHTHKYQTADMCIMPSTVHHVLQTVWMPLSFFLSSFLLRHSLFSQHSLVQTLSGSISSNWIDGSQTCWLRCCQIWWGIGKLCLATTLEWWSTLSSRIFSRCRQSSTQLASACGIRSEFTSGVIHTLKWGNSHDLQEKC